jgi:hypothetical protein
MSEKSIYWFAIIRLRSSSGVGLAVGGIAGGVPAGCGTGAFGLLNISLPAVNGP